MLEPIRVETNVCPDKFVNLGTGRWYYNYDIQSFTRQSNHLQDDSQETIYSFIQVISNCKPDYKTCVQLVIRAYITQDQEFDLINSYNRTLLGLIPEEDRDVQISKYQQYLELVNQIKFNVKADFGIS